MLDLKIEPIASCLEEMKPLLADHWLEVAAYQDKIKLAPDYDRYLSMGSSGILRAFVLRDNGVMVGYWLFVVVPNPHYMDDVFAVNDICYLKPDYRVAAVSPRCFAQVEAHLKGEGVSVITYHMKTYKPFEALLRGLGYDHLEHLYGKCLKE